ncbi:DNA ligase [Gallaecimonas xiamenensis]|uniref:DNA ligase n=1 Tax=Gallaecimonas xiamenensis 3-C-1 TaxID=745411 RepID=K2J486_9GAMM|nr:DNA ligase [Gallaecimonas xiamenensis]EKE77851.1 DNA ligase [Gallaecimonas xiamenensis 3-C-1]
MKTWLLALLLFASPLGAKAPLLATPYQGGLDLKAYWVSEKLDGIRGRWDGKALLSKSGKPLAAPAWFTRALPPQPLDGELWLGRGHFQALSAIVLDTQPDDAAWQQVRYMLFDLPGHPGPFDDRLKAMEQLVAKQHLPWLAVIPQFKVASEEALFARLDQVIAQGGEGLMLHRGDALYQSGRSPSLIKLKKAQDMEGTVLAILPGKGKYQGMMGALLLELDNGVRFKLGSGFSDDERRSPPKVGARVTFAYQDLSLAGKPRFARFIRVRPDGA